LCEAEETGKPVPTGGNGRKVIGVDIDIRSHNRVAIEAHPLAKRICMIEGSSTDPEIVAKVQAEIGTGKRVLVALDSNHSHAHVRAELDLYAPMVSVGSYCVVFDSVVENLPKELSFERPWGPGDNPMTAVHDWIVGNSNFSIDKEIESKLLLTVAPDGFLRRDR
ncbi:MAG: CmcI family methyltransferase, partial [Pseudomonadota bacterium]